MPQFHWVGVGAVRHGADLRHHGWLMREESDRMEFEDHPAQDCVTLLDAATARLSQWRRLMRRGARGLRKKALVLGVGDGKARARLLRLGFGDALPEAPLGEIEQRARRVADQSRAMPRWRCLGPLLLDLLTREAFCDGRSLGLYPREFALLWRLMEQPGQMVSKHDLLRQVWNLSFVPDTNSLAVHACRLRARLAQAGLEGWLQGAPAGGYCLASPPEQPVQPPTCRIHSDRL